MRGMVALFLLIAAQGFVPAPTVAAPNDFRVISGTLLHPATLGPGMTVMVLKSDEGTVYYADLRAVSGIPALQQGAKEGLNKSCRRTPRKLQSLENGHTEARW